MIFKCRFSLNSAWGSRPSLMRAWLLVFKEWLQGWHFPMKDKSWKYGFILLSELVYRHTCKIGQGFPWEMILDLPALETRKTQTTEQERHRRISLGIFLKTGDHQHSHRKLSGNCLWYLLVMYHLACLRQEFGLKVSPNSHWIGIRYRGVWIRFWR